MSYMYGQLKLSQTKLGVFGGTNITISPCQVI